MKRLLKLAAAFCVALDTWIIETRDRGEFEEAREIVALFEKERHDWFGT